ncbi:hypothetical protein [Roseisolibacter agri]|uniref:Uncharacterized protein n=1 Tax=Roseisolibacter agri TaxID=2014610 RepID=A0AA37V8Y9_9BACT|nr:hypothetical protein [Roseisolibacter agri]GLC23878.1 hypothetical protein rosag_03910 [Roseisolibacter agri]
MACPFESADCPGLGTPVNQCGFCRLLEQDQELQAMVAVLGAAQVRPSLELRAAALDAALARGPMPALPMNPGRPATLTKPAKPHKHVNRAAVRGDTIDLDLLERSAGDQNCALCSCAGCVNLAVGYVKFTTKKVAKLHGKEDGYKALGMREEQEQKIIAFVSANLPGYTCVVRGSDSQRLELEAALDWMRGRPDETVFVISTTGGMTRGGARVAATSWGHWSNAIKRDGSIVFVDFQTDHQQRLGRGFVSTLPILGNFGVDWDKPKLQVIAFEPPPSPPQPVPIPYPNVTAPTQRAWSPARPTPTTAQLPIPVGATPTTQQLVPLATASDWQPSARKLKGMGMNYGTRQDLDAKFQRQARLFNKLQ